MIVLSLVLVIIAAVTLVLGVFQDGLTLIYVSIGTCLAAMVLLGIGVLVRRREDAEPAAAGYGARPATGGATESSSATSPAPARTEPTEDVRVRDADTEVARPSDVPPAKKTVVKKAVIKKVSAASTTLGASDEDRDTRASAAFEPERDQRPSAGAAAVGASAPVEKDDAPEPAAGESEAGDAATGGGTADAPAAADQAAVTPPAARKVAVKKAAAKKATAKKATAKKATAKKAAAKKATAAGSASALPKIRGLGPAKAGALLDHFGSVEEIRKADIAEITAVRGVGEGLAKQLKRELGDG